jgi:tetratricopeptide (TPR) repeat protein
VRDAVRQNLAYAAICLAAALAMPALYTLVKPQWVAFRGAERAFAAGRHEEAAALYARAGEQGFDLSRVLPNLGDAYLAAGNLGRAIPVFDALLKREPGNHATRLKLAELLARDGRYDQALAEVDKTLEAFPSWRTALYMQARILTFAGRFAEAIPVYQKLLGEQP